MHYIINASKLVWCATENAFIVQDNDLMALKISQRKVMHWINSLRPCSLKYGVSDASVIISMAFEVEEIIFAESTVEKTLHR